MKCVTMSTSFLDEVRSSLAPLNKSILEHPFIIEAEEGTLPIEGIKRFVKNQNYIISHDVRSLALMISRSTSKEEFEFFDSVYKGDAQALPLLLNMAQSLELKKIDLDVYTPVPEAVSYAHYLTFLAQFATPGEQTMALVVNLPIWGSNCNRLSKALREKYGIDETSFLDLFAQPIPEAEKAATSVINHYLDKKKNMEKVAKLIQGYELMFWNGIYRE